VIWVSLDTGIVFRIRHYWEIWKVVNGHSFIVIRQMAALVRRALAEVCASTGSLVTALALTVVCWWFLLCNGTLHEVASDKWQFRHYVVTYSSSGASKVTHGESSFLMPADDHKDIVHTGLDFFICPLISVIYITLALFVKFYFVII